MLSLPGDQPADTEALKRSGRQEQDYCLLSQIPAMQSSPMLRDTADPAVRIESPSESVTMWIPSVSSEGAAEDERGPVGRYLKLLRLPFVQLALLSPFAP